MTFKLTILGSSSALPSVNKYPSAHVLNIHGQFFLIDAGEGVQTQLRRYNISLLSINHIFISHLHGDHVYGLFGLISTMGLLGREQCLNIYAPAPIQDIIDNHIKYFDNHLPYTINVHTLKCSMNEPILSNKYLDVYVIPLRHRITSCGFMFKEKPPALNIKKEFIDKYSLSLKDIKMVKEGYDIVLDSGEVLRNEDMSYMPYKPRSFAYCSDTSYSAKVIECVKGVDMLYHESTFLNKDIKIAKTTAHTTALQAAKIAKEASVGKLVLGHFSQRYNGEYSLFLDEAKQLFDNSFIASEGVSFEIQLERDYNP